MDVWATPFLKFNTNDIFRSSQCTIKYNFFEKYFNLIIKILATSIGLLFSRLHRS